MNAVALAAAAVQLAQLLASIAQTQAAAHAANRDVTDAELDTHRQRITDARAKLLADLAAGS